MKKEANIRIRKSYLNIRIECEYSNIRIFVDILTGKHATVIGRAFHLTNASGKKEVLINI